MRAMRQMGKMLLAGLIVMAAIVMLMALAGCSTTKISDIDPTTGKVSRITETNESIAKTITESTKNKTCLVYTTGWVAKIKAVFASTEDPLPTFDLEGGNADHAILTVPQGLTREQLDGLANVVTALRANNVSMGATGISSSTGKGSASTSTSGNGVSSGGTSTDKAETDSGVITP